MTRHRPYRPQIPADIIRVDTCDSRRSMNPLPWLSPAYTTVPGCRASVPAGHGGRRMSPFYRALAPHGATLPLQISATHPVFPQPILNSEFLIPNWTFTFSAKEKDAETGLSYFGSRYYSSDLSIWLSVDPMSDKYASLSPYVYCADNPVRCVDPDGEAWEVNQDGYIRQTGDENDHTLYAVKGKGEEFGDRVTYRFGKQKGLEKSISVSSDVMKKMVADKSTDWDGKSQSWLEHDYTKLEFWGNEGIEDAKNLICFLSKNTDVEWSIVGGLFDDKISTTIYSSHKNNREYMGLNRAISISANNNLYFFFHSHPRNEIFGWLSDENDRKACGGLFFEGNSPNAQVGIIHKGLFFDFHGMRVAKKDIW